MAGRGGVHISYLIVSIVLNLGLIGALVKQNSINEDSLSKANKSTKDAADAKETAKRLQQEIDLARVVIHGNKENVPDYNDIRARLDEMGQKVAASGVSSFPVGAASLFEFTQHFSAALDYHKNRAETEIALRKAKEAEYQNELVQKEELRTAMQESVTTARQQGTTLQTRLDATERERNEEVAKIKTDLDQVIEEKDATIHKTEKEKWVAESLLTKARERISYLEQQINLERTFDKVNPDGEIVEASADLGYAWINIGKKDKLTRETIFDVFEYVKGGARQKKGRVEVLEVGKDLSKVKILEARDPLNPIAEGDRITSPFYDKNETPIFVIAGEHLSSNRMSIDELKRRISDYGGVVEKDVRIETRYLVALPGYENTPEYKAARELKVTVLREEEIMSFFEK